MKKAVLISLLLLSIFRQVAAEPDKKFIWPAVLALLAEGGTAATTITATDLAILGTATVATSVGVSYYIQNPPNINSSDFDWDWTDEVLDIRNTDGGTPPGGKGPRFTPPHMWDEEKFILILNLANAGYQGYLRLIADSGPTKVQVQDQLSVLYQTDPVFARVIDQMQKDYNSGKMVAIPTYRFGKIPNGFVYMFRPSETLLQLAKDYNGGWKAIKVEDPKPGDAQWSRGVENGWKSFNDVLADNGSAYDYQIVKNIATGDCMGDPNCAELQEKIVAFLSDEEFLGEIYSNPELLQEFWALMKALDIYKQMPEGEAKQKLKDFLCFRRPSLWICGGEYDLQIEAIPSLIDLEGVPEDIRSTAIVINAALNSAYEEYEAGLITEDVLMERVLALEEEAEALIAEYAHEMSMVTRLKDANLDPSEDLIALATKLLDCMSRSEFLRKQLRNGNITKAEFDRQAAVLKREYDKLAKQFRDLVKDGYVLPENVWEAVNQNAFNANWVNAIIEDINGSRKFGKLKIVLQIYQRVYREMEKVFISSGLHNDWRTNSEGRWGGARNSVAVSPQVPTVPPPTDNPDVQGIGNVDLNASVDPSQAGSGSWDFIDYNIFIQQLDEKSTDELLRMLVNETSRVRRDAILTILFRRGITGEDLSDLFDDGSSFTLVQFNGQYYVFFDGISGEAQEKIFLGAIEGEGTEGQTLIQITTDGGFRFDGFTDVPGTEGADALEAQMDFEEKVEEVMEKLGYHKEE